jgi:hypothetical protein
MTGDYELLASRLTHRLPKRCAMPLPYGRKDASSS